MTTDSDIVRQILVCNCGTLYSVFDALYSLALRGRDLYTLLALASLAQGNDCICTLTFRGGIKRLITVHSKVLSRVLMDWRIFLQKWVSDGNGRGKNLQNSIRWTQAKWGLPVSLATLCRKSLLLPAHPVNSSFSLNSFCSYISTCQSTWATIRISAEAWDIVPLSAHSALFNFFIHYTPSPPPHPS